MRSFALEDKTWTEKIKTWTHACIYTGKLDGSLDDIIKKKPSDILMLETHTLMLLEGFISKGKIRIDCFKNIIA